MTKDGNDIFPVICGLGWTPRGRKERKSFLALFFTLDWLGRRSTGHGGGVGVYWVCGGNKNPRQFSRHVMSGRRAGKQSMLRVVYFGWFVAFFLFFFLCLFLLFYQVYQVSNEGRDHQRPGRYLGWMRRMWKERDVDVTAAGEQTDGLTYNEKIAE